MNPDIGSKVSGEGRVALVTTTRDPNPATDSEPSRADWRDFLRTCRFYGRGGTGLGLVAPRGPPATNVFLTRAAGLGLNPALSFFITFLGAFFGDFFRAFFLLAGLFFGMVRWTELMF
jgi:hypothetical protein